MNKSCALRKKFFWSLVLFLLPVVLPVTWADDGKFEVVSIKRTEQCTMQNSVDPGRIALIGDPLKVLLREGCSVKLDQIIGPSWLDEDCYAVIAKIPEGATKDQLPAMYRALLADYFKIVTHT